MVIGVVSSLLLEYEEFVSDEVPDERDSGSEEFGDIGPEHRRDAECRSHKGSDAGDDRAIDAGSREADGDELGEFRFFAVAGDILECPVFVHEIAVDDGDEERDGIEYEKSGPARDAGQLDFDIEYREIDSGIDAADEDEFRKLFGHPKQPFPGKIHVRFLEIYG